MSSGPLRTRLGSLQARLGRRALARSAPLLDIDNRVGKARRAPGRIYVLGCQIGLEQLPDDEGHLAPGHPISPAVREWLPWDGIDRMWLTACNMARGLDKSSPTDETMPCLSISWEQNARPIWGSPIRRAFGAHSPVITCHLN